MPVKDAKEVQVIKEEPLSVLKGVQAVPLAAVLTSAPRGGRDPAAPQDAADAAEPSSPGTPAPVALNATVGSEVAGDSLSAVGKQSSCSSSGRSAKLVSTHANLQPTLS